MANDTLTFALGGKVTLQHFEQGTVLFRRLIFALSRKVEVTWVIDDLQPGSAVITLRGESAEPSKVEEIIRDYGSIGRALEQHETPQYGKRGSRASEEIMALAGVL